MPTLAEIIVLGIMPFLYGAATRLPFIYFVIHLNGHFELSWGYIGLCVAAYQGSRVITSALAVYYPRVSHFMGTAIGLAGYTLVFFSNKDLLAPFVAGTAIVGFSETMSSMQKYAKHMYKSTPDPKRGRLMLKYQYASVMIGVVFAFSVGGFVYQYHKINGVALFGIIIESLSMLALLVNFYLIKGEITEEEDEDEESVKENDAVNHNNEGGVILEQDAQSSPSNRSSDRTSRLSSFGLLLHAANTEYSTAEKDEIAATWLNWMLCVSFGIEALTIGYNLSIGPIFLQDEFKRDTGMVGILFAVGAASGSFAAISITCTEMGKNAFKKIAASPFDVVVAFLGIAIGVSVAAVPNFGVHVLGLVLLMCFNDLGATVLTELQASITTAENFSFLGPLGQVVRRSLNVATALTGPLFYGYFPRLPYIVAAAITFMWTVMLYFLFKYRVKVITDEIAKETGRNRGSVMQRVSFARSEMMHSTISMRNSAQTIEE
eukprot:CAMPEP_0196131308 /NCGR_PEP_ID=MMETSP0910-20130528/1375_1 /TAXON_ID=49265 /ORGANISM="Thalassiosira rotula, Strain GSO102" /LENGTH=489 /DNA_ID=CAMNT_0041390771 /DNA_START=49 /DNA_END=1518 /DNA_ORIENTATION=+